MVAEARALAASARLADPATCRCDGGVPWKAQPLNVAIPSTGATTTMPTRVLNIWKLLGGWHRFHIEAGELTAAWPGHHLSGTHDVWAVPCDAALGAWRRAILLGAVHRRRSMHLQAAHESPAGASVIRLHRRFRAPRRVPATSSGVCAWARRCPELSDPQRAVP